MTPEQDAVEVAFKGVAKAINNDAYINLDARQNITTMRENYVTISPEFKKVFGCGGEPPEGDGLS